MRNYDEAEVQKARIALAAQGMTLHILQRTNPKQAGRELYGYMVEGIQQQHDLLAIADCGGVRCALSVNNESETGAPAILLELTNDYVEGFNGYAEMVPFLDEPFVRILAIAELNGEGGVDIQTYVDKFSDTARNVLKGFLDTTKQIKPASLH